MKVIIQELELEARNELLQEKSAFVNLSLELVGIPARLERLAMSVFLCTLDACTLTRPAIGQHRVAFYFLPTTAGTCLV